MGWLFDGSLGTEQFWWGILDKNNIRSFHLCMISGNRDEAWPMYLVWPISERVMLGRSGGTWPACCHWPNTGRVDGRCPIMSVLTQSYQCGAWFVCSTLREVAVSNLGQLLFCLSITWSRCRNAYRDLWIMTVLYINGYASLRIQSTDASGCFFTNVTFTAVAEISIRGDFFFKSYHKFVEFNLFFIHLMLFWIDELIHIYSI